MKKINTHKNGINDSFFIGWRSCKDIQKKAMEQKFSLTAQTGWSGLLLSVSIAFFVVFVTAMLLNFAHDSIKMASAAPGEFKGQVVSWDDSLSLKAGEEMEYSIVLKNVGDKIWKKGKVNFETGPFLRSFSDLKHESWLNYYRLASIDQDVNPGETIEIKFSIRAKAGINGTIQENFQLVQDNYPISGTLVRLLVNIQDEEERIRQEAKLKNGNNEIKSNEVAVPVIVSEPEAVAELVRRDADFCVSLSVAEKEHYQECNTDPNENDSSNGITENIIYTSEPIIRVGLFKTIRAQRITCETSSYSVFAGDKLIFLNLKPGYTATVSYSMSTGKYVLSTPGATKFSKEPIRFVPSAPNAIMTLVDFKNRPAWNASLNYNQYRNIIEFQYSKQTGNFWVINELPISYYLKGLAETSNYSPVEYQKVIVTAARTYAMYHYNRGIEFNVGDGSTKHGNEHFHIDATYDQVYKGYGSEKLMSKLSEAVDETKGTVVTYDGKVVVTPYFSRSDGRTRSWEEVWYGDVKPWLVSVDVPQDNGQELWGHGVGMSARGALIMTRDEGESWGDTLKYFYQNTELQKIYD